ncbi:MAG: hypothetical protein KBD15_01890 [Candidatus Magasanikbacteria bacterium]|nr:hypothetical protein [Candidatus Magasanikbacteria bacterium]
MSSTSILNSALFAGLVTVGSAWLLFFINKRLERKKIAKLILQEIRKAESIIVQYKENQNFKFKEKVIENNSWVQNIHYFANLLDKDELDKISLVYSLGTHLDDIIKQIALKQLDAYIRVDEKRTKKIFTEVDSIIEKKQVDPIEAQKEKLVQMVSAGLDNSWNNLFADANSYMPIYHSTVTYKLKRIAYSKLYWLF